MNKKELIKKILYAIWIPRKITQTPRNSDAVISDLFPLRCDSEWETHFELLNISGLISGDKLINFNLKAHFIFFDGDGVQLGEKVVSVPSSGRRTISLDQNFHDSIPKASSFSVFHQSMRTEIDIGESFLAERGYTGYRLKSAEIKGYVHGNLDALAYESEVIQTLGNSGLFERFYYVQHPLRGPARYEFFISNPTDKKLRIRVDQLINGHSWITMESFELNSKGSRFFEIEKEDKNPSVIRLKSRLYLGRPVVFRISKPGFDVFHG